MAPPVAPDSSTCAECHKTFKSPLGLKRHKCKGEPADAQPASGPPAKRSRKSNSATSNPAPVVEPPPAKYVRDLVLADLREEHLELAIRGDALIVSGELTPSHWDEIKSFIVEGGDPVVGGLADLWRLTHLEKKKEVCKKVRPGMVVPRTQNDMYMDAISGVKCLPVAIEVCKWHVERHNLMAKHCVLPAGSILMATGKGGVARGVVKYPTVNVEGKYTGLEYDVSYFVGTLHVKHSDIKTTFYRAPGRYTPVDSDIVKRELDAFKLKLDGRGAIDQKDLISALDALKAHGVSEQDIDSSKVRAQADEFFATKLACAVYAQICAARVG